MDGSAGLSARTAAGELKVCAADLPPACRGVVWERAGEAVLVLRDSQTIAEGRELIQAIARRPHRPACLVAVAC